MCAAANMAKGLAKMSLDDFLQEDVSLSQKGISPAIFQHPSNVTWEYGRWGTGQRRPKYQTTGGGRGRGVFNGPPRAPRREGVQAGVMLTHDPPPVQPLMKKTPLHRPTESVLTIGSHEAHSVKENIGGGRGGQGVEGDLEVDLEAVLTNAQPQQEINFIYGQRVDLVPGQRCHLLPVNDLSQVRRNTVLKLLVGLLNAGEKGVIYMGLSEDGRVEGITTEYQFIGQFVEGLMKTVQFYLMPRLHAPQYGVRYTNVVTTTGQLLNNVWVVELHAVPQMQHYYNPVMDMNYHVRQGKETKTLPFVEFCHVVVGETSKALHPEVQRMEEKVLKLRQALEAKGVDTSAIGPHVCDNCYFNDCPVQCYGKDLTQECDVESK